MIEQHMGTTALVFVGHSKDRLIDSIRSMRTAPVGTIVLITGEQDSSGETISRGIAEELERDLSPIYDVKTTRVDKKDVVRAARQITELVRDEQAEGNDVIINMSGSLYTFAIAGYIAGCITGSRMITAIPEYDRNDREIGIEEIIELPVLPLSLLKDEQQRILAVIGGREIPEESGPAGRCEENVMLSAERIDEMACESAPRSGGLESLDELVLRLNPGMKKGSGRFSKERSRLSHHLKNLEEMGLIEKEKRGKNVGIRLTGLGEMMVREP